MFNVQKDDLTEFFLRKTLHSFLEKLIAESASTGKPFSLVLIDLDKFKKFNDKYGHPFGDEILKYMSSMIRLSFMGSPSHFFRYGGDEFIVLLPEKDSKQAYQTTQQFKYNMAHRPFLFNDNLFKITSSCGISSFPHDGSTIERLVRKADEAMYYSKKHGRNSVTAANKLRFFKVRNVFFVAVAACIIFETALTLFHLIWKKPILHHTLWNLRNLLEKVEPPEKPEKLDIIILTNDTVLRGKILEERENDILFNVLLDEGSASFSYQRSQIKEIHPNAELVYPDEE